jgi:hypothetical protein
MASVTLYGANPYPTRVNSGSVANPNYTAFGGPQTFAMPPSAAVAGYFDIDGDGAYNNGIGIVTAHTEGVDHLGREVTVWNYVPIIFSLQVSTFTIQAMPAANDTLFLGDTRTFEITVHDSNNNPVVGSSEISFTASDGQLSVAKITTDSPGKTKYYVGLKNNLNPLTDDPGKAVVTATLTSPNGNVTASDDIYMSISSPR